jgi:hypothetical protein
MTRKRSAQSPEYAVSDEAAACIADALMELALQFEASHFAQIRRHAKTQYRPAATRPVRQTSRCKRPQVNALKI